MKYIYHFWNIILQLLQCLEARLKRKCSPWMFSLKESINFFPVRNIPRSTMIEGSRLKGDRAWLTYMQFTRCNSRRDKEWLVDYWCVTLLEYYLYENGPCENTMRKIVSHRFRSNRARFWMNNVKQFPWKWLALQAWLRNCTTRE